MPPWLSHINTAPLGLIDYGPAKIRLNFPYLATANCAFRRTAIVDAGMFNVRLGRQPKKLYADEDTDMVARILAKGGKVMYEPQLAGRILAANQVAEVEAELHANTVVAPHHAPAATKVSPWKLARSGPAGFRYRGSGLAQ